MTLNIPGSAFGSSGNRNRNIKHTKRILGSGDGLTITMKRVHMRIIRQFNEQEKDTDWNHIQTLYKRTAPIREC